MIELQKTKYYSGVIETLVISPQAENLERMTTHATVNIVFTALPFPQALLFPGADPG